MPKIIFITLTIFTSIFSFGQRIESVYLNPKDSTSNMYMAVFPETKKIKSFMILLDGFGNSPKEILLQTSIPKYAAQHDILTIIPILKTGPTYFGSDSASQQSLKEMIKFVVDKYELMGKDFYIGGFSIGGTCAIMYAELSVQKKYPIKPTAVFVLTRLLIGNAIITVQRE